jgi:hypothetical protein
VRTVGKCEVRQKNVVQIYLNAACWDD